MAERGSDHGRKRGSERGFERGSERDLARPDLLITRLHDIARIMTADLTARVAACRFALPTHAHVPGSGSEPDRQPLDVAKRAAHDVTLAGAWPSNEAYIYGFALHQGGYFWEAHEVWERVWLAAPPNSRERLLLRALIQLANARLKERMGRSDAARRLDAEVRSLLIEICVSGDLPFMGVLADDPGPGDLAPAGLDPPTE